MPDVTVYVEIVVFNNLAIDLLLIVCTFCIKRRRVGKWRAAIAAAIGASVATAYAVTPVPWNYVIRALLAPVMVAIFYKPQGKDALHKFYDFLGALLIFTALTFFMGGAVYGASYILGIDVNGYASLGLVALGVTATISAVRAIVRKRSKHIKATCKARVTVQGKSYDVDALCDSGNLLTDPFSGLPVVMISKSLEERLACHRAEGFIDVATVGGDSSLALVALDSVEVNGKNYMALGALTGKTFSDCELILQSTMF